MRSSRECLLSLRQQICQVAQDCKRDCGTIQLIAVSKSQALAQLEQVLACGQQDFGESYVQEALPKIKAPYDGMIRWHFIGPIQSNKCRDIAQHFAWVHSLSEERHAVRLSRFRGECEKMPPLNVCLQVNISGEQTKSGLTVDAVPQLARVVRSLPHLRLRGLMTIPAPCRDPMEQRIPFRQLHDLLNRLNDDGYTLDSLSMGMSDDWPAAIAEGATHLRLGAAIFGSRK